MPLSQVFSILLENQNYAHRLLHNIISLLFFLSWMIMSIIRADVWIAILAGVMVLISAAQLYLAFKAKRR